MWQDIESWSRSPQTNAKSLGAGSNPITATYSGDAAFASSNSPVLIQKVAQPPRSDARRLFSRRLRLCLDQDRSYRYGINGRGP
ncbi:MAG TPA: Ig-like domain-containing protein, partial [Bryobacteraceae bacterium]